ncbi:MAG: hypothetical protein ABW252_22785 [Polyangiales bacterium]
MDEPLGEGQMRSRSLGRGLLVIRCTTGEFSESVWTDFLKSLHAHDLDRLRVLVRTDGASPSIRQLRALVDALAGRPARFAIVTDEGRVLFVTSALATMIKRVRSFHVAELLEAYRYLELTAEEEARTSQFFDEAIQDAAQS